MVFKTQFYPQLIQLLLQVFLNHRVLYALHRTSESEVNIFLFFSDERTLKIVGNAALCSPYAVSFGQGSTKNQSGLSQQGRLELRRVFGTNIARKKKATDRVC